MTSPASPCSVAPIGRRRLFWATKPDACGVDHVCSTECGRPGLSLLPVRDECQHEMLGCHDDCDSTRPPIGFSYDVSNYAVSLALNIILTDQRNPDTECGHMPGNRGGHWSDSYRKDGAFSGSRLRYAAINCGVFESVAAVEAFLTDDLQKLITYGVAKEVTVKATYAGNNSVSALVSITDRDYNAHAVGVTGTRSKEGWRWAA